VSPDPGLWQRDRDAASDQGLDLVRSDGPRAEGPAVDGPLADQAPPPPAGRLVYATSTDVRQRTWDPATNEWSAPATLTSTTEVCWTQNRILASGQEVVGLLSKSSAGMTLELLDLGGSPPATLWSALTLPTSQADKQSFDIQSEASGELLVAYAGGSTTPVYRTRTLTGSWSAPGPLPGPNNGTVLWVKLVPRAGTDTMTLLHVDDSHSLVAIDWDGAKWLPATATTLATDLKTNPSTGLVNNRAFDGAYESKAGDLLVAWGIDTGMGFDYSVRSSGGAWSAVQNIAIVTGYVEFIQLAPNPNSDQIAGVFLDLGNGTERLGLATWDGGQWLDVGEYDSQIHDVNDGAQGDLLGGVVWAGTSAVAIYPDDQQGTLDWASWNAGDGWVVQTPLAVAGKGYTESVQLTSKPDGSGLLAVLSDDAGELFCFAHSSGAWAATNSGSLATVSVTNARPFSFALSP